MSLKALARKVIERETVGETILPTEPKKDSLPAPETPEGEKSFRSLVEELLAEGPRPYADILAACGGNEAILRDTIRGWDELIAYDAGGTWFWKKTMT